MNWSLAACELQGRYLFEHLFFSQTSRRGHRIKSVYKMIIYDSCIRYLFTAIASRSMKSISGGSETFNELFAKKNLSIYNIDDR